MRRRGSGAGSSTPYSLPSAPPGDDEALVDTPGGQPGLLFPRVPEGRPVKNRVHLDLRPHSATRGNEVDRLLGIGATFPADFRRGGGSGFVALADPDGSEFCVERSDGELAAAGGARD